MDVKPYTADLLFEIGVEEMPSAPLNRAVAQLEERVPAALAQARLGFEEVRVLSTPRRLAVLVRALAEQQEDAHHEHKGPAKTIAYTDDGSPTKALEGFARGKDVPLDEIVVRSVDGVEYVYAVVEEKGLTAAELLPDVLAGLVTGLEWPKTQRWGSGEERFIRPVRWLLALLGTKVIPFSFGEVESANLTYGHRFLSRQPIPIQAMREYKNVLRGNRVLVDQVIRRDKIVTEIAETAAEFGKALVPDGVLDEVVNLTEYPNALLCEFDREFLRVPREILEYAMSTHQRYFAIERADGTLDNHFVVISNGDPACADEIARGHERVVRARLADAAFFYDEDLKVGLEGWRSRLDKLLFQEKLGSVADKAARTRALVAYLCETLSVPNDTAVDALRAAELAKADLTSNAVVEFTDLQGVMGSYYALAQGENPEVAMAIAQHYRPRFAGDALPETAPGQLVSLADKTDTIVGIFAAGKAPKGTSDPFALRRSAIGVLRTVMDALPLNIGKLVEAAISGLPEDLRAGDLAEKVNAFFMARLDSMLRDRGFSTEVVSAVLSTDAALLPADAAARCDALQAFLAQGDAWEDLSTAYTRAKNLSDATVGSGVDADLLGTHERAFYEALETAKPRAHAYLAEKAYGDYLSALAGLRAPVDDFFEQVMIMDEDPALRRNRLALLNQFIALIEPFADFRRLSK